MPGEKDLDALINEVTGDGASYGEQLQAFFYAFEREIGERIDAHVLGEPVQVDGYEYGGNEKRGIIALVEKDGSIWEIALVDVAFAVGSREARLVDALRRLIGVPPVETAATIEASEKKHKAAIEEVELGVPIEAAVLAVKQNATRLRLLDSRREITLRGSLLAVPGEIATVIPKKAWTFNKHPYMSVRELRGVDVRLDVAELGLTPLEVSHLGTWDPAEHYWGEEGEPLEDWAKPIHAAGPRPSLVLEEVVPGYAPMGIDDGEDAWDEGPIREAVCASEAGEIATAHRILEDLLARDLRCLDAHAHLGNLSFDHDPGWAIRHYQVGVEIARLSLVGDIEAVLPWGCLENRPFLRCLHGYGLCLWRLGQVAEAVAAFERLLWLNPTDNQGARFLLAEIDAGRPWEETGVEEWSL